MFNGITEESGGGNNLKGKQYVYPRGIIDNQRIGKPLLDFGMDDLGNHYYQEFGRNYSGVNDHDFYDFPEDRLRDVIKDNGLLYLQTDIYDTLGRRLDEHQRNNSFDDKPEDAVNWKDDDGNYTPAQSFKKALLDDKTGGSFKDTLNN